MRTWFKVDGQWKKNPEYQREWRKKNPNYTRNYYQKHRQQFLDSENKYRDKHPERVSQRKKRYREMNPEKIKAINLMRNKAFPLTSQCELCGSTENLHHHHPDYSEPEIYITVCLRCHRVIHRKKEN